MTGFVATCLLCDDSLEHARPGVVICVACRATGCSLANWLSCHHDRPGSIGDTARLIHANPAATRRLERATDSIGVSGALQLAGLNGTRARDLAARLATQYRADLAEGAPTTMPRPRRTARRAIAERLLFGDSAIGA